MLSAFFLISFLLCGLLLLGVLAAIASVFRSAFSIVWWPVKIVGVLLATVVFLAVGLPLLVVAIPVMLVLTIIAIPFLLVGCLCFGGLSLVGLA